MLLEVKGLSVKYGKIEALKDVSLSVKEGELTTLLGANGAGKTTLLKTISGLLKPFAGEIVYLGRRLDTLPTDAVVRAGISHCPEGRKVFPRQTVYENLKIGAYTRRDGEVEKDIEDFFAKFPRLGERRNQRAGHLSGGEQQMLVICRALMSRPKLLLLDEPSMGLAPFVVREVFALIQEIHRQGVTILLVEQNAKMALKVADKGYILEVGRVVAEDSARNLLASETVRKSYLGG
ncbi:MAG: ABC transporter ATP-binding protein [Bacillota bacterium]|nr:ABC transporter ATP-binding protein [Bacillota bacterium]